MKTPTKVPTNFAVPNNFLKSPRMVSNNNDLSEYLETSRDFPLENIDPNTTANLKEAVRSNPNLVTTPLGSATQSPSLNVTPDSRRRLLNFQLRNTPQHEKSHFNSPVLEKTKQLKPIGTRRRSVSSSSTLDNSVVPGEGKISRAESIEAVALSKLDPNHNLTQEAQFRVLNYEYRGPLPAKSHCQRSLFNTTANESSKEVKVVKNPPQTETPKKPKGTIS
ncbi:hypothetical protein FO519_010208, partial [Halicephalobus sp. NKZ332]